MRVPPSAREPLRARVPGVPHSLKLGVGIGVGTLILAYLLATAASFEFRLFLLWALVAAVVAIGFFIKYRVDGRRLWLVLAVGIVVKLLGSMARYQVIFGAYEGNADAGVYYSAGLEIARGLWRLDPSSLLAQGSPPWGTAFLRQVTGVLVSISGPSTQATFVLFAALAFLGVVLFASSYNRIPGSNPTAYLAWLVLWPSMLFWPSSIGKEAFLIFCLGLAVWGYSRFPRPVSWPALIGGLLLAGMVRPHIAGVAAVAMAAGAIMVRGRGLTGTWYFQAVVWVVAMGVTVYLSAGALGIESAETAVDLVEQQAAGSNIGDSAAGDISISPLQIPSALLRALFRPFVWEANSPFMLVAALEVLVLVGLMVWRRRELWASLREWRHHRLIGFSLSFVLLYSVMLGFAVSNLGILARQRVLLLPMLLLLLQRRREDA